VVFKKNTKDVFGLLLTCSVFVTTHIVRLKLFRLKAEGVRKERLPHFGGEPADFRIKHGFKVRSILAFPNSLQPLAYPPE
jgi:hypothetical protein